MRCGGPVTSTCVYEDRIPIAMVEKKRQLMGKWCGSLHEDVLSWKGISILHVPPKESPLALGELLEDVPLSA